MASTGLSAFHGTSLKQWQTVADVPANLQNKKPRLHRRGSCLVPSREGRLKLSAGSTASSALCPQALSRSYSLRARSHPPACRAGAEDRDQRLTCGCEWKRNSSAFEPLTVERRAAAWALKIQRSKEVDMKYPQIAVLVAAALVVSPITPALAQGGGGGGGGSGGGSGGASVSGGASDGGATTGTVGGGTNNGMNSQQTTPTQSTSKAQTNQDAKSAATSGSETTHSQSGEGAVSGPGVGVGTSTNGKPIGSPGSGLGSPENPVDARKLR